MVATNSSSNATTLPTFNECRYAFFDEETKCRSDRNCADCLRKKGCRIGTSGFCEPDTSLTDTEDDALDYKNAVVTNVSLASGNSTSNTQKWHFPASEVKYCDGGDAVCSRCSKNHYGVAGYAEDSRFCVGAAGCVCVQNCRKSFLEEMYCLTDEATTPAPAGSSIDDDDIAKIPAGQVTSNTSHGTSSGVWIALAAAAVLVVLVLLFVFKRMRTRRARQFEGVPTEFEEESRKVGRAPRRV